MANTAISTTIYPRNQSLDEAYNVGQSITVDTSAITLTGSCAADNTLYINQTGVLASAKSALSVYSNAAQTTGDALCYLKNDNAASTILIGLGIWQDGAGGGILVDNYGNGVGIEANNDGTNHGLYVHQDGVLASNKYGFLVYSNAAQVNNPLARIHNDNASSTGRTFDVISDSSGIAQYIEQNGTGSALHISYGGTTAYGIVIEASSLTTGSALRVWSDCTTTDTRNVASIINDNTAATGARCLYLQQDANYSGASEGGLIYGVNNGTGHGVYLVQGGVLATNKRAFIVLSNNAETTGIALGEFNMTNASSTKPVLRISNSGSGMGVQIENDIGTALYVYQNGLSAGKHGILAFTTASTNADSALCKFYTNNVGNTEPVLELSTVGSGSACLEITCGAGGARALDISQASTSDSVFIDQNAVPNNAALYIDCDASSGSTINGQWIAVDNAGAGAVIALILSGTGAAASYAFNFSGGSFVTNAAVGGSQDKKIRIIINGTPYFVPCYTA